MAWRPLAGTMNKSIGLPILPAHSPDARDQIHRVIPGEAKPIPGTSSRIERNFLGGSGSPRNLSSGRPTAGPVGSGRNDRRGERHD